MPKDSISITSDTTLDAVLESVPKAREVLIKYFGAGVTVPGQTWTHDPLSRACLVRGVDEKKLLADLRKVS